MKGLLLGLTLGVLPLSASAGHQDYAPSHRGHEQVSVDFRYSRHDSAPAHYGGGYGHRDSYHGHGGAVIGRAGYPAYDGHWRHRPRPVYGGYCPPPPPRYCPPPPPVYCPPVYRIQPYPPICR